MPKTTGFDHADHIPAGTVIQSSTYHVAGHYGPGKPHDTFAEALAEGVASAETKEAADLAFHGPDSQRVYDYGFSVDLRWNVKYPAGTGPASGEDTTVKRTTYASVEEARAHLTALNTLAGPPRN